MKFYMYKYDGKLLPIVTLLFADDRVSMYEPTYDVLALIEYAQTPYQGQC